MKKIVYREIKEGRKEGREGGREGMKEGRKEEDGRFKKRNRENWRN